MSPVASPSGDAGPLTLIDIATGIPLTSFLRSG
jgi:hypothetical protein